MRRNFITRGGEGVYSPVVAELFGNFLTGLFADLDIKPRLASREMRVDPKTVWNWLERETIPQGDAVEKLAEFLVIPENLFRAAAGGSLTLPADFRKPERWRLERAKLAVAKAGLVSKDSEGNPAADLLRSDDPEGLLLRLQQAELERLHQLTVDAKAIWATRAKRKPVGGGEIPPFRLPKHVQDSLALDKSPPPATPPKQDGRRKGKAG